MINPKILYEDSDLFVIDKPSGWITNEADTTSTQPVVQTWMRDSFEYELKGNVEFRDGVVHRLDKETSGVLVIAKTKEAFLDLQRQFKERLVEKTYTGLLHGKVEPEEGKIQETVGRLPYRRDRFGIIEGGRESLTYYKVIKHYKGNNAGHSLVEFYPKTGRTHQIRIHARHIGHAIVADEFYAGRKTARNDRKWCPRLFLHAKSIEFLSPTTMEKIKVESKLPFDLENALSLIN